MYNFNEPREGDKRCYRAESLHDIVVDKGGWEYIVEGTSANPKPGYAAYTPGTQLEASAEELVVVLRSLPPTAVQ
eukprot:gene3097-3931_t